MIEVLGLPFFQRGIVEILLLAGLSGLIGTWIVLRGLAFFAHAAGTATVPGLVLADGLAFPPLLGALGAALLAAAGLALLAGRRSVGTDSATALVLAGALAAGVILASDVFGSQGTVDRLLFGSLLAIGVGELAMTAATLAGVVLAGLFLGRRWLSLGFTGRPPRAGAGPDLVLMLLVALAVVAALGAVGALLTGAILVVPAATARLFTSRLVGWQLATAALAAVEGVAGLGLSFQLDVPPGAAVAVLSGLVFALAVLVRHLADARRATAGIAGACLLALLLAGCGAGTGTSGDGRLQVTATTTQIGDLVREVGGSRVAVNQVLRPNTDAHDYEPRPTDVARVADSRLLFASGLGLDRWARELVDQSGSKARVVDLGAGLPMRRPAGEGGVDPHWWHDPENLDVAVTRIEKALAAADPEGRRAFAANARAYRANVRRVSAAIRACLERVPGRERVIVTDHDALGYFTERYGIRTVGTVFPSTSTQGQASAGDVAALERTIRQERVRVVFPENSLSSSLADRIARDTGVSSGAALYGDSLGPSGGPAGTVLGAQATNARRLARGMSGGRVECSIPA